MAFPGEEEAEDEPLIVMPSETRTVLQKIAKSSKHFVGVTGRVLKSGKSQIRRWTKGEEVYNVEAMGLEQGLLDSLENEGIQTDYKTIDEAEAELEE